jgi:hypothetical protein
MEAPKCKLCGERHWGLCPSNESPEPIKIEDLTPPQQLKLLKALLDDPRIEDKGKFDRTAYQREYMRKWRAARKQADE